MAYLHTASLTNPCRCSDDITKSERLYILLIPYKIRSEQTHKKRIDRDIQPYEYAQPADPFFPNESITAYLGTLISKISNSFKDNQCYPSTYSPPAMPYNNSRKTSLESLLTILKIYISLRIHNSGCLQKPHLAPEL